MDNKGLFIFLVLLMLGLTSGTQAQVENLASLDKKNQAHMGINALLGIPQGIFADKQIRSGFGFGGNLFFEVREPISLGLDVGWQKYDTESDVFIEIDQEGFSYLTEEETSNQILSFKAALRLQPEIDFFVKPYVDGYFGVNRFYTRTTFKDADTDELLDSSNNHSDWALTYGAAAGFLINVKQELLFIDLKCGYHIGNTAEYYTRIEGSGAAIPLDNFELSRSPTNFILPQIGITFLITSNNIDEEEVEEYYEEEY